MVAIARFSAPKDPDDVDAFVLDFALTLPPDDTVVGVDLVDINPANLYFIAPTGMPDLSCAAVLWSGQNVTLWLRGGQDQWRYLIGVIARTAGGRTLHRHAVLQVVRL